MNVRESSAFEDPYEGQYNKSSYNSFNLLDNHKNVQLAMMLHSSERKPKRKEGNDIQVFFDGVSSLIATLSPQIV